MRSAKWLLSHKNNLCMCGNERQYIPVHTPTAEARALAHLKNNCRKIDMTQYLSRIICDARAFKQSVAVVIPPVTPEYRQALPDKEVLFRPLNGIKSTFRDVQILDYYDDAAFSRTDFIDWDHLSMNGACKLTEILRERMC